MGLPKKPKGISDTGTATEVSPTEKETVATPPKTVATEILPTEMWKAFRRDLKSRLDAYRDKERKGEGRSETLTRHINHLQNLTAKCEQLEALHGQNIPISEYYHVVIGDRENKKDMPIAAKAWARILDTEEANVLAALQQMQPYSTDIAEQQKWLYNNLKPLYNDLSPAEQIELCGRITDGTEQKTADMMAACATTNVSVAFMRSDDFITGFQKRFS